MRILMKKQQKDLLVSAAVLQHRMIELGPVLHDLLEKDDFRELYRSMLSNLYDLAAGIDPAVGVGFMDGAFEMSKSAIKEQMREMEREDDDEQGDHDREPGE